MFNIKSQYVLTHFVYTDSSMNEYYAQLLKKAKSSKDIKVKQDSNISKELYKNSVHRDASA